MTTPEHRWQVAMWFAENGLNPIDFRLELGVCPKATDGWWHLSIPGTDPRRYVRIMAGQDEVHIEHSAGRGWDPTCYDVHPLPLSYEDFRRQFGLLLVKAQIAGAGHGL